MRGPWLDTSEILCRLETISKGDFVLSKIVRNYLYNVSYHIFLIIVPLITAPYLSRVLSSESLGVFSYINSVVSVITTFGILGLQSYGFRQIAYDRDDPHVLNRTFSSIFELRVLLLLIITVVYIPVSFFSKYKAFFLIQYALIAAQFIDISWLFIGLEDLKIVSLRNFLAKFLTVIGIFIFVKEDSDLWIYFALFAFITLVTAISVYPIAKKYVVFRFQKLKSIAYHIVPAVKLFLPQIATTLYLQFDKIMLQNMTGSSSQVAYYDYAEKFINIPLAVITALSTVMMPRFANLYAKGDDETLAVYLKRIVSFALFVGTPMMFGMASIAEDCIPWYLGEEYTATAAAIIVLSPICIISALSNVFGAQYLSAVNKTNILTIAYYGAALVNIVCNALLIPQYGYMGAAVATTLCLLFSLLVQYNYVRKRVSFASIYKEAAKILCAGVVMYIIVRYTAIKCDSAPVATLAEILIGIVVYFVTSLMFRSEMLLFMLRRGMGLICHLRK